MKKLAFFLKRCLFVLKGIVTNPFFEWNRFWTRVERRTGIPTSFMNPVRFYIRAVENRILTPLPKANAKVVGNYILHSNVPIKSDSVVYSAGVGQDIEFDRAVTEESGANVYMVDPTPQSKNFIEALRLPAQYKYFPVALFTYDGEITFYPHYFVDEAQSSLSFSVNNDKKAPNKLTVPCMRLTTLMKANGHTHIDVLKMDIEGVADAVLEDTLNQGIKPKQVVCEFEMPANPFKAVKYVKHLERLFSRMKKDGYEVYSITHAYFGTRLEVLSVLRPF